MANTYGWAIDLSITETSTEPRSHIISINLSLPGGNTHPDWLTTNSPPIDIKEPYAGQFFEEETKILLMPSKWDEISWLLVKVVEGQVQNPKKLESLVEGGFSKNYLQPQIDAYLKNLPSTKQNKSETWLPFDLENIENGRTLVHALAPLAYLPAEVSTALNRSFVYTDDLQIPITNEAEPAPSIKYIVYPEFKIGENEYKVDFSSIKFEDNGIVKIEYKNHNVVFYCNIENNTSASQPTLQLIKQEVNPAIWKATVLGFISPASLLIKSVLSKQAGLFNFSGTNEQKKESLKNQIKYLALYLFRTIGAGWGLSYVDNTINKRNARLYDNLLNVFIDLEGEIEYKNVVSPNNGDFLTKPESVTPFIEKLLKFKNVNDTDLIKFIDYCDNLNGQLKGEKEAKQEPLLEIMVQLQNQEILKKVSVLCWVVHNNFEGPSMIDCLEKIIKAGISQEVLDQAQFALLVESPFQNKSVSHDLRKNKLPSLENNPYGEDPLSQSLLTLLIEKNSNFNEVNLTIAQEVKSLYEADEANKQNLQLKPKDDGLKFAFADNKGRNRMENEKYRGYAIALEVSDNKSNWKDATWITDVQIGLTETKSIISKFLHETIGATETNGATVGSFEYNGNPLVASKVKLTKVTDESTGQEHEIYELQNKSDDENNDGTDYIDYVWPSIEVIQAPKLGYGLWYRGIATPLGNAGEIFDNSLWDDNSNPIKLKSASEAIQKVDDHTPQQYLSFVPPGAPTVIFDAESLTKLQELSEETKAYAYQVSVLKSNKPQPVALLCSDKNTFIEEKSKSSFKLRFHRPIPTNDFFEKWLNGNNDNAVAKKIEGFNKSLASFQANKKHLQKLDTLKNGTEEDKTIADDLISLIHDACKNHPAVENVLVKASINCEEIKEKVLKMDGLTSLEIIITDTEPEGPDKDFTKVLIKCGSFCRVELFSLIEEKFFDGEDQKFDKDAFYNAFKNDKDVITNKVQINGVEYRQFGPAEYWFEAAPIALTETKPDLAPIVKYKDKEALIELKIANELDATWIRGVEYQRHEWHWTGYPLTFPEVDSEFDKWLSSFIGVESYRQEDNHICNTHFDGQNNWKIGNNSNSPLVVHQHQLLSGPRPAKYIAFSVRPKVRFSKWIWQNAKIRKDIESKVFVNGSLAKGIPLDVLQGRIPVPLLKWVIPLTATYTKPEQSEELLPEQTQNGNLLIFDEAFKRTDSLVRFGGIGDTIDIEVMETRIRDIHEFGVNPIFHGYEKLTDQTLIIEKPFGLTYDITRNAKVAQTGIVVRPQIANGKWMLAKVRARRFINPNTLNLSKREMIDGYIQLPLRKVGDTLVPIDFCIDFESSMELQTLKFGAKVYEANYALKPATRFLVTFEKFDGQSGWKIGVAAQLKNNTLDYETIDRVSSFSESPLEIDEKLPVTTLEINKKIVCSVKPLVISDYTDPVWLTFIGTFGIEAKLLNKERCSIKKDNGNLVFRSEIKGLTEQFKPPADDSSAYFQVLMVYEPVQDIYKTGKELDGGRFIGFYVFESINSANKEANFVEKRKDQICTYISKDAYAYLITLQKATAMNVEDKNALSNNTDLMSFLFPESKESTIRITPEYMGPIKISL